MEPASAHSRRIPFCGSACLSFFILALSYFLWIQTLPPPPARRTEALKAQKAKETPKIQEIWKIRRSIRPSHEVLKTLYLFGRCLYQSTWAEVRGQLEGIGSLLPPHHTDLEDSILVFRLRSTFLTPWATSLTCFHEMENAVGSCQRVPTLTELHTAGHRFLGVQLLWVISHPWESFSMT